MLDALAVVGIEVFLDLRAVIGRFVDGNADAAARARHRLGLKSRELALDIEIADLAEVEQALVELRPLGHAAAVHVVRQVIDEGEPDARGRGRVAAPERLEAGQRAKVDVVNRVAVRVLRIAVDEVDERVADSLDGRDVELAGARVRLDAPGATLDQLVIGGSRVAHPECHRAYARTVAPREVLRERARLRIQDEVDVALLVERDVLVPMARHALEAEGFEERAERFW